MMFILFDLVRKSRSHDLHQNIIRINFGESFFEVNRTAGNQLTKLSYSNFLSCPYLSFSHLFWPKLIPNREGKKEVVMKHKTTIYNPIKSRKAALTASPLHHQKYFQTLGSTKFQLTFKKYMQCKYFNKQHVYNCDNHKKLNQKSQGTP